jgi:hypothetical protein
MPTELDVALLDPAESGKGILSLSNFMVQLDTSARERAY